MSIGSESIQDFQTVIVYHTAFPGKGIGWANDQIAIIPAGWMIDKHPTTHWTFFWYPDQVSENPLLERINFFKLQDLMAFVRLTYKAVLDMETPIEKQKRPRDPEELPGWISLDTEWVDKAFETAIETDHENEYIVEFLKVQKQSTPAAKYGRSEKGKLAQKKYRQSDTGKERSEERKETKNARNQQFKAVKEWLEANPGKTLYDLPKGMLD